VIRLVSLLQIVALSILLWMCLRTEGRSAIGFSFVGIPVLGLALVAYAILRWREGGFRNNARPPGGRAS
jgi:hypothetical protein